MNIFVTGGSGRLGSKLIEELTKYGHNVIHLSHSEFDISNINDMKLLDRYDLDTIIHCAAYTNVDKAETDKITAYTTNFIGTKNLVDYSKQHQIKFMFVSTDFVFNGVNDIEIDDNYSNYSPLNYYGFTKKLCEDYIRTELTDYFIVRTQWLFSDCGSNFILKMVELSSTLDQISVVNDQIGRPTYVNDLVKSLNLLILTNEFGVYNITNSGSYISKFDLCKYVFEKLNIKTPIVGVSSDTFKSTVKRPLYSKLKLDKILNVCNIRNWEDAVDDYLKLNLWRDNNHE